MGGFVLLIGIQVAAAAPPAALAQGATAIVTGTEKVFVRRGPGNEFPPFASIPSGSTVEVQEVLGEWTRISTASGQVGFVNSQFLSFPGEPERRPTPPRPTPTRLAPTRPQRSPTARPSLTTTPLRLPTFTPAAAGARPTATAIWLSLPVEATATLPSASPTKASALVAQPTVTPAQPTATHPAPTNTHGRPSATPTSTRFIPSATVSPTPTATRERISSDPLAAKRIKELEAEVETLREEMAQWKRRAEATPLFVQTAEATPAGTPDPARELERLASAVEAIEKRLGIDPLLAGLEPTPTPVPARSDEGLFAPWAIFTLLVGLLMGAWFGSSSSRKLERSRRSRLRF